ncbi:Rpn family recombination-promoting nuclease/putative transposase (plasmid) [Megamonas funiformis]|nr:Rpn family recombination-promoting nuclease/putative transposase [Megamonas funiformis]
MTTPAIKEAVEFEDTFLQDKIERRAYEQREKAIRDYYSYISAFKEEGIEQGLQRGLQQGENIKAIKIAIKMLNRGDNIEDIADITELSIEEINKLRTKI